jgi:rod shape-determining protein MreD
MFFGPGGQMLHLLPLFLLAQIVAVLVRLALGAPLPGWSVFIPSLSATLLWPLADRILLAPQRRVVELDENRPI